MSTQNNQMKSIQNGDIKILEEDLLTFSTLNYIPAFPKYGQFNDSYEYYQILFKLFRANFLFPLSDQLIKAIHNKDSSLYKNQKINPLPVQINSQDEDKKQKINLLPVQINSQDQDKNQKINLLPIQFNSQDEEDKSNAENNQAEQNEYYSFDVYETFEVLDKEDIYNNITVKVSKYVSEITLDKKKHQIKYKDLVIFFDPETKKIYKGIVIDVNSNDLDVKEEYQRPKGCEFYETPQLILQEQEPKIQLENDEIFALENFSRLRLIRSKQYWYSISSCFQALMYASRIGSIAFSDQTLNGNPATNFPNYSQIDQKSYMEAVSREVAKLRDPNEAQKKAIIHAMTTESAFIQGPPGTGKSFVAFEIRKLLLKLYYPKSKKPILFITKKNVTLDEQLERDFKAGHKVVRIGNQNSQKVEEISFKNLFQKYTNEQKQKLEEDTKSENSSTQASSEINELEVEIEEEEDVYASILTDEQIRKAQLEGKTKQNRKISQKLKQDSVSALEDLKKEFKVTIKKQKKKARVNQKSEQTQQAAISIDKQTPPVAPKKVDETGFILPRSSTKKSKGIINTRKDFLNRFEIIGMTFSGSHINYEIIYEIKPEIIIIEEASEVIETELAPLLGPWVKHIIQIGDFKQLRPFISYKQLSEKKNYGISYFERLITKHDAPSVDLTYQKRMHPNLSIYSRQFYNKFYDDVSVQKYSHFKDFNPSGAYFFHHTYPEEMGKVGEIINEFEARFIEKVVNNILAQKLKNDKGEDISITVLTMYNSQFELISKLLWGEIQKKGNKLRVSTVDSFQGQESDVILLSCVRSNPKNSNRFILEKNRVNVAMSRARLGLFVIGNLVMLRNKSKHWDNIIQKANNEKSYFSERERMPERFIKYGAMIPQQLWNKENTICIYCKSAAHLGKC